MKQFEQISGILHSRFALTVIPTNRHSSVRHLFQHYSQNADVPVYTWTDGVGLQTLEKEPLIIPDTESAPTVLDFIQNSLHYAVYLLQDFPYKANSKTGALFNEIILNRNSVNGKIILVGPLFQLDPILQSHTLFVDCGQQATPVPFHTFASEDSEEMPYIPMEKAVASMGR